MENQKLLNDLIEIYISKKLPEAANEENDVRELLTQKVRETINDEIIQQEKERIIKESKEEIDKENEIKKKKQMKIVVIETLILGFFIGLLVNQGTDVITYIKGGEINIGQTLIWILILIILNLAFGLIMYLNKLDEIFNKNKLNK